MGKHLKSILVVLGIFILVIFIVEKLVISPTNVQPVSYSAFYSKVQEHQIKKVTIAGHEITGDTTDNQKFSTTSPPDDRELVSTLRNNGVDINVVNTQSTPLIGYVFQFVPFIIMALLLIFILRQAQSGGSQALSFGRSRAKLLSENRPKVTFADVAGVAHAFGLPLRYAESCFRAGLGLFGVLSAAVVVVRLASTWRVAPAAAAHQISLLGQRLSYPTANGAAIVLVVLAAVGLAVTGSAFWAMLREASRSIRLRRALGHATAWDIPGAVVIADDRMFLSLTQVSINDASEVEAFVALNKQHVKTIRVLSESEVAPTLRRVN